MSGAMSGRQKVLSSEAMTRARIFALLLLLGWSLVGLPLACSSEPGQEGRAPKDTADARPNIVFIFTDDQDAASLREMPNTTALLKEKGTIFKSATFAQPLCCPSRATMLRGQYPHNTGITTNTDGPLFKENGLDESTLATWLDGAGYETALIGKYLNLYPTQSPYIPPGWDEWFAGLRDSWADCFNENGQERCYRGHPDSIVKRHAVEFVHESAPAQRPFFLWASFSAPHYRAFYNDVDADKFTDAPLPGPPSFNETDVSDKPAWVREQPRLTDPEIKEMAAFHRDRLRSLQTVDRAVEALVAELKAQGELGNTYFFFWTDNGHHLGQHRLPAGKNTPYIEDLSFPLVVRGPNVPEGESRTELVANTDLAPTMADLAGTKAPGFVDGRSFAPLLRGESIPYRERLLIESPATEVMRNPAYTGIRTASGGMYIEYEGGEKELYDLEADPYELENLLHEPTPEAEAKAAELSTRLESLKSCSGDACRTAENSP